MDTDTCSEILHYKRGIYYINQLLKTFPNGEYNKDLERDFFYKQSFRFRTNEIAAFDLNNFSILCAVALIGLNKESIEASGNSKDYKYDIDYSCVKIKSNFNVSPIEKNLLSIYFSPFKSTRKFNCEYDEWLSINNLKELDNYVYNYLSKVRNSFMHSEYNFDLFMGRTPLLINVKNTDYTNFSAMIHVPKFLEFVKHYFSNDGFFGLVENLYIISNKGGAIGFDSINDDNSLIDFLKNNLVVNKINYNNKLKQKRILERKLFYEQRISADRILRDNDSELVNLSDLDVDNIFYMIKSSYKDEFYNLSDELKCRIIVSAIKYRLDPKSIISGWVMHFYLYNIASIRGYEAADRFVSTFAMLPSLLLLKSYLILYRLQNKELSKYDIDLDKISEFDYNYDINNYTDYKMKQINKGIILDEDCYKRKYFCEIFRNSLAHGNVKIDFKKDADDNIVQYFCFSDIYKSRIRDVFLSVEDLGKFLSSDAFSSKCFSDKDKCMVKVK